MLNAFMPLRVPPRSCNPEPFPPHAAGFSPGRDAILAEHKGIGIESQVSGSALSISPARAAPTCPIVEVEQAFELFEGLHSPLRSHLLGSWTI